jgi:4'-phosphopantetheinyl transferase EntD
LGVSNFPVQRKKCGQPVWPNGITGSISHCSDYCCVAVGQEKEYISIGLDVEKIKPLEVSIWNYICTNEEQFWLHSLVPEKQHIGVLLLFSAKECYFKYQFPLTTQWLDFHDVRVRIKSDLNEFEVIFTDGRDQALKVVTGRYVVTQHHIFTGIAQPTLSEQEHS